MIDFYPNPSLNAAANRIKENIDEVMEAIMPMGDKTHAQSQIMQSYMSDGVDFAKSFLFKNLPDVQLIQKNVSQTDEIFIQINDGMSAVIASGCRMFSQMTNIMMMDGEGFKRNTALVEKTGNDITEALRLFSHIQNTTLSHEGRQNAVMNLDILKQVKKKYDSLTKKSWWS